MAFVSTRGGEAVSASAAILRGIAPNGGLYVPETLPVLTREEIAGLADLPYASRAAYVLNLILDDYSEEELLSFARQAYASFECAEVAPIREIKGGTHVMELFHGPTLAFKDMALQMLPHLLCAAARKQGEQREVAILTATSGDTGKAALEGFRDVDGTSCTVFYPLGGVSRVQERQMLTSKGKNVHVIGVHGNFDDAQTGVKTLFADQDFIAAMNKNGKVLSSANSINLGRLVPQVAYYISAAAEMLKKGIERFNVCVPTGNFGNILAAWYAKRMGAPIDKLICASNCNDVLTEFIRTGHYNAKRPFMLTVSPSMDILISSNLERLLYELVDCDSKALSELMAQLKQNGEYTLQKAALEKLQAHFECGSANDDETKAEIGRIWNSDGYVMDTHTAVAMQVLRTWREKSGNTAPTLLVSTASPFKFAPAVTEALGLEQKENAFDSVRQLSAFAGLTVPAPMDGLETNPVLHDITCEKNNMGEAVLKAFGV